MNRMTTILAAAAALAVPGLGGTTPAMADQHTDASEVQAFLASPMTVVGAVSAAEKDTGGKAMSVDFDTEHTAKGQFEVEVAMADGMTRTVAVNPADGTVTAMSDKKHKDKADDDTADGAGNDDGESDQDSN